MADQTKNNFISGLITRNVPKYLGTYFAVGFGLLQFLSFIAKRYDLSGALVDKYLLVWLTLVPAIAVLSYFNGKLTPSTESGVLKWPKYLVFGNIILAFLLGGFLPTNKEIEQKSPS